MKKTKLLYFYFILLIVCFSIGCKKNDFRDAYTGKYDFTYSKTEFITNTIHIDTTEYYSGEITNGTSSNKIAIHYLPNYTFETGLNPDGAFEKVSNPGHGSVSGGSFETEDKVSFGSGTGAGGQGTIIVSVVGILKRNSYQRSLKRKAL